MHLCILRKNYEDLLAKPTFFFKKQTAIILNTTVSPSKTYLVLLVAVEWKFMNNSKEHFLHLNWTILQSTLV